MNTTVRPNFSHSIFNRGNVLLVTLVVIVGLVAVIGLATDRVFGERAVSQLNLDRDRASFAAQSLATLLEAKLVGRATEIDHLKQDIEASPAAWWNLDGCCHTDASGNIISPTKGLWINGCVVRWRLEPVKVLSQTDENAGAASATFSVNREPDPNLVANRAAAANSNANGSVLMPGNPPFFHFRIITEAYALKDQNNSDAAPWLTAGLHTCAVQAQRVVQMNLVNLFDHVIFYAAKGETGDIEFQPQENLEVMGSVHSNGAIYMGGYGESYTNKKFKKSSSDGGDIIIGTAVDKADISGYMGIYRLRKAANYFLASPGEDNDPELRIPSEIPLPGQSAKSNSGKNKGNNGNGNGKTKRAMSGNFDLNGGDGDPANEKVALNGAKLTYYADSRVGWALPANQLDPFVRDKSNGGELINTIANAPDLAGYPLEPQRLAGVNVQLYQKISNNEFTVNPSKFSARAVQYTSTGGITTNPANGVGPVFATDMPLFMFTDANGQRYMDIWPTQPLLATDATLTPSTLAWPPTDQPSGANLPGTEHTFLPKGLANGDQSPARGYYMDQSLSGDASGKTGLTIRERGQQNTAFKWIKSGETALTASGVVPILCPIRTAYGNVAEFVSAYTCWLKSQYVVYLGKDAANQPIDITAEFFDHGLAAAQASGNIDDLIASRDQIMNRREAHWLNDMGYLSNAAAKAYRVDILTLHLSRICNYLLTPRLTSPNDKPSTSFNGLIYIHRTPRTSVVSGSIGNYNPLAPFRYHPLAAIAPVSPPEMSDLNHLYVHFGTTGLAPLGTYGSADTWALYPYHSAVRISQGEAIDWGETQASGRARGLSVITPNHCYVRGNYNTVLDSTGKIPPCAIFADTVTVLSNLWNDADNNKNAAYDGPLPKADNCAFNASFVINNLPTDEKNLTTEGSEGSGGIYNVVHFLEDWDGKPFTFTGSLVVMNRMRYSRGQVGTGKFFNAPIWTLRYNPDLFTSEGQPPFSPTGIKIMRVVNTIDTLTQ